MATAQELTDISQHQRQLAASVDHLAGRLHAIQSRASAGDADDAIAGASPSGVTSVEKAAAAAVSAPPGPVNLNTASKSMLQTLPRIGRASADNIIAARPFTDVTQLADVAGISPALFEDLRTQVTV
jgi:DNA uptake protein ComE-like DNA-binding protein